tara:strand:+ start:600 stop:857 length:258 start_codon:yes stop_codon:yes gene_type:complete
MKEWMVFQAASTPGILSAKNSTTYIAPAEAITQGFSSISRLGGRSIDPVAPMMPSMAQVAYRFRPLAQAAPIDRAINAVISILLL